MAFYRVVAIDMDNQHHFDLVEAESAQMVAAAQISQGRIAIKIERDNPRRTIWAALNRDVEIGPAIRARELIWLSRALSGFLSGGLPLYESLRLVSESARRPRLRSRLLDLLKDVREGQTLESATRKQGFPPSFVAMVGAGELSGNLASTLERLAIQLQGKRDFSEKVRTALIYPAFLTITASGAILVLLVVVVPNLQALVETADRGKLPYVANLVMRASEILREYGGIAALLVFSLAAVIAVATRFASFRGYRDRLIVRLPVVGPLTLSVEWGRYFRTLSTLLMGGVPMAKAMPLSPSTVSNRAVREAILIAQADVLGGATFGKAIQAANMAPKEALQLAEMGERTGRLPEALSHAADMLERSVRDKLELATTLTGPVLTVVFGVVAGTVVYAMLSTILSINEFAFQ